MGSARESGSLVPSNGGLIAFVNVAAPRAQETLARLRESSRFDVRPMHGHELGAAVRRALTQQVDRVVIAGGDGSVREAAAAVADTAVELAIIPAGTLNHRARDLGIPLDISDAIRTCFSPHTRSVSVGRVNGSVFLNTSAVGSYVTFVRNRERAERWLGYRGASAWAAVRLASRLPVFHVTLHIDGVPHRYATPLVFIGVDERELKHPTFGARVPDGRSGLHVMVVRQRSRWHALKLVFVAAMKGVGATAPALDAFLVDECRVDSRHGTIALDGQLIRMKAPLAYGVRREALHVVVP